MFILQPAEEYDVSDHILTLLKQRLITIMNTQQMPGLRDGVEQAGNMEKQLPDGWTNSDKIQMMRFGKKRGVP